MTSSWQDPVTRSLFVFGFHFLHPVALDVTWRSNEYNELKFHCQCPSANWQITLIDTSEQYTFFGGQSMMRQWTIVSLYFRPSTSFLVEPYSSSPFYYHGLTLIQARKNNHIYGRVGWNYLSIPKLQRCNRWSLGMDKLFHPTLNNLIRAIRKYMYDLISSGTKWPLFRR